MKINISAPVWRYWLAMNASAVQSAAHTTKTFVATATAHALENQIPALNLWQAAAVFGLAFVLGIMDWLDSHPLDAVLGIHAPDGTQPASAAIITSSETTKN